MISSIFQSPDLVQPKVQTGGGEGWEAEEEEATLIP